VNHPRCESASGKGAKEPDRLKTEPKGNLMGFHSKLVNNAGKINRIETFLLYAHVC